MEHSDVYNKLVKDKRNLAQVAAYSLYKSDKVAYFAKIKEEEKREPDEQDAISYNKEVTQERLDLYLQQGTIIVNEMADSIARQASQKAQAVELERIARRVNHTTFGGFFKQVGIGALGSLVAGLVAWAIYCAKQAGFL